MIDVLLLERLQRDLRFPQDLVLPGQELGAKIIALALVHERLFFGRSIVLQLFQGQPIFHLRCRALAALREEKAPRAAPYIARSCDRQYCRGLPTPWTKPLHRQIDLAGPSESAKGRRSLVNNRR